MTDDKRLERLFDYTKFHIGIYLSSGGALIALLGSAEKSTFLKQLIGCPVALLISLAAMAVAGLAGGVVASSATQCETFEQLWSKPQGPYISNLMSGKHWAFLEHTAFWASLMLFAYAVLSAPAVWAWIWA